MDIVTVSYYYNEVSNMTLCVFKDNGVRLLSLRGNTPDKYSLSLMDALFGEKVMAKSSFGTIKSSKPSLPQDKMQLLQGIKTLLKSICCNGFC